MAGTSSDDDATLLNLDQVIDWIRTQPERLEFASFALDRFMGKRYRILVARPDHDGYGRDFMVERDGSLRQYAVEAA